VKFEILEMMYGEFRDRHLAQGASGPDNFARL